MRTRGFTLVELMVVVTIIAIGATLAARYSNRTSAGEQTGEIARAMILAAHEARESAISLGQTTRLRVDATNKAIFAERWATNIATPAWVPLGAAVHLPSGVDLCDVKNSTLLVTGTSPTCPTATNTRICFAPSGRVGVPGTATSDTCPPATNVGTGATLYVQSRGDLKPKKFKLMLFALTGMPRMTDTW